MAPASSTHAKTKHGSFTSQRVWLLLRLLPSLLGWSLLVPACHPSEPTRGELGGELGGERSEEEARGADLASGEAASGEAASGEDASGEGKGGSVQPSPAPLVRRASTALEREGLRFDLTLEAGSRPEADKSSSAHFEVKVTDVRSGAPVPNIKPLVWLTPLSDKLANGADPLLDPAACRTRIQGFTGGLLSARSEAELNAFLLLSLNHDNTITVINPQVAFDRTKLQALISLPGPGADWVLHPGREKLYVSVPSQGQVVEVDLGRMQVARHFTVGARPGPLLLADNGRRLWMGLEGRGALVQREEGVDTLHAPVEVGAGPLQLLASADGARLMVLAEGEPALTLLDMRTGAVQARVSLEPGAKDMAYSAHADALWVSWPSTGQVASFSASSLRRQSQLKLEPGLSSLAFAPGGRFAFGLNPTRGEVSILDAATAQRIHRLEGFQQPDVVSFTEAFAYIRDAGHPNLGLISLPGLERGEAPVVVEVAAGQQAPREARRGPGLQPIVPTPDGTSVFIANPADLSLYYDKEGMMAPIGSHRTYGREPRALLLLDRSLKTVGPGHYETPLNLRGGAGYSVALAVGVPKVMACMELRFEGEQEAPTSRWQVALEPSVVSIQTTPVTLKLQVETPQGQPPVKPEELGVLLVRPPSTFQQRLLPTRDASGALTVSFLPPRVGRYQLLLELPSRGESLTSLPPLSLEVKR